MMTGSRSAGSTKDATLRKSIATSRVRHDDPNELAIEAEADWPTKESPEQADGFRPAPSFNGQP